jgi:flagellar basal body L-ring protein FlgH
MRILLVICSLIFLSSCGLSSSSTPLKSPCVSVNDPSNPMTPCVKRNVNDHWLL